MGDGTGTFIKIDGKFTLKDNCNICLGDTTINISFTDVS
jgi:rRNA maturation protein Nop10